MEDNFRNPASSTVGTTREKVREKAAEIAGKAKEQITTQYDEKKGRATNEVQHLASALRRAGDNLRDDGSSSIGAAVLSRVAGHLETVGTSMEGKDIDTLIGDVERLARRNPAAFIGGAMLIGFAVSRFLKSSSRFVPEGSDFDYAPGQKDFGTDFSSGSDFGIATGYDTMGIGTVRTGGGTGSGTGSPGSMGGL